MVSFFLTGHVLHFPAPYIANLEKSDNSINSSINNSINKHKCNSTVQWRCNDLFNKSVLQLSHIQLFTTPWIVACQASLSITNARSLLKLISIESVMPSNHLILCHPLLLLCSIFPSIRVFSSESVLLNHVARVLEFQLQHQSSQ